MIEGLTEKDYEIHYYEIDCNQRATLPTLIDLFTDVATFQSEEFGVGINYMMEHNMAWVLYKWDINIIRYPKYREKITVSTKAYSVRKFYAYRKFYILDSNGSIIAEANSVWLLINIKERKPLKVPDYLIKIFRIPENEKALKIGKFNNFNDIDNTIEFKVRYSDIDTNGHVNNEKYASWMIESVPSDVVKNYYMSNIKITYKKETKYGETVNVLSSIIYEENKIVIGHKIIRKDDGEELTRGETIWEKE